MWRCLREEYGIAERVPMVHFDGFSYEKDYADGTCENEFCLVTVASYGGKFKPNEKEVEGKLVFVPAKKTLKDGRAHPEKYTIWFVKSVELLARDPVGRKYLD